MLVIPVYDSHIAMMWQNCHSGQINAYYLGSVTKEEVVFARPQTNLCSRHHVTAFVAMELLLFCCHTTPFSGAASGQAYTARGLKDVLHSFWLHVFNRPSRILRCRVSFHRYIHFGALQQDPDPSRQSQQQSVAMPDLAGQAQSYSLTVKLHQILQHMQELQSTCLTHDAHQL